MSFDYWFMFPLAIFTSICANSSGFAGGILFQPIYNIFLNVPIQNAVATGIATETVGMTSGSIRYYFNKMIELNIAFVMIMLIIPGVVIGNYALQVLDKNVIKFILGGVMLFIATLQLISAAKKRFGTRNSVPVEDIYPFMWIPPLAGFFTASAGAGNAEILQPLLNNGLELKTKRANATAIFCEASADWIITILNLHAGLIRFDILMFTVPGVIIGSQIGAHVSKYLPDRLLKMVFSSAVIIVGCFYITHGIQWLLS
jgi:hypothetical protein